MNHPIPIASLLCLLLACQTAPTPPPLPEAVVYQPQAYVVPAADHLDLYWGWFTWDPDTYPRRVDPDRFDILVSRSGPDALEVWVQVDAPANHFRLEDLSSGEAVYVAVRAVAAEAEPAQSPVLLGVPRHLAPATPLLPGEPAAQSGGSWAPGGQALAYTRWPADSAHAPEVVIHDFATGKASPLGRGRGPAWAPEGGAIAYREAAGEGRFFITLHNPGGTERLVAEPAAYRHLAWSPDARQLLYEVEPADGQPAQIGVFTLNSAGPEPLPLTGSPAFATWHPNGDLLAYGQETSLTGWDIQAYTPALQAETPLLATPWQEQHPAFSPDGGRMAFISDRSGLPAVWVVNLITQALHQLTDGQSAPLYPHDQHLSWDPAGRQVIFTGMVDRTHFQLMAVPAPD